MFNVKKMGERIRKLRGKCSQDECAKALGISRGALSFYENGERKPDADVIYMMAEHFNVSADYILGLTKEPNANMEIQAINKLTGLSEKSINEVSSLNEDSKKTLNLFIENNNFGIFITALSKIVYFSNICEKELIKSAYQSGYDDVKFYVFDKGITYDFIEKYINDNVLLNQFLATKTLTKIQDELAINQSSTINTLVDKLPDSGSVKDCYYEICSEESYQEPIKQTEKAIRGIHELEKELGIKIIDTETKESNQNAQHNPKKE